MQLKRLHQLLFLFVLVLTPFTTFADSESVANSPKEICPLLIGSPVPEIRTQTLEGKPFDLTAALKAKPTILIYFRGGW